jgi:hypothetical protein
MKWFRWYRGTVERAKFRIIADRASSPGPGGGSVHMERVDGAVFTTDVLAVWVTVLEDAGNASHWGYVTRYARDIATMLDLGVSEVEAILAGMVAEEMIESGGKRGHYHIVNWEKYQFTSDTDPTRAERQKRFRQRRTRNALRDGPVTRTDTDLDPVDPSGSTADAGVGAAALFDNVEVIDEDPQAKLFRVGKTILVSFGVAEKRTGALLGMWLKSRNDPVGLLAAIKFARDQNVVDPVAYVSAMLKEGKANGQKSAGDRAHELAEEWRRRERDAQVSGTADNARGTRPGRQAD